MLTAHILSAQQSPATIDTSFQILPETDPVISHADAEAAAVKLIHELALFKGPAVTAYVLEEGLRRGILETTIIAANAKEITRKLFV